MYPILVVESIWSFIQNSSNSAPLFILKYNQLRIFIFNILLKTSSQITMNYQFIFSMHRKNILSSSQVLKSIFNYLLMIFTQIRLIFTRYAQSIRYSWSCTYHCIHYGSYIQSIWNHISLNLCFRKHIRILYEIDKYPLLNFFMLNCFNILSRYVDWSNTCNLLYLSLQIFTSNTQVASLISFMEKFLDNQIFTN